MPEDKGEIELLAGARDLLTQAREMLNESRSLSQQLGQEAVECESFEQEQAYLDVIGELIHKIDAGMLSFAEMEHYSAVLSTIQAHDPLEVPQLIPTCTKANPFRITLSDGHSAGPMRDPQCRLV